MNQEELKKRSKQFSVRVVLFVRTLPRGTEGWAFGDQLIRAGTSVGANYRAACRAKTRPTFIHKIGIVEEEADECCFWLEVMDETGIGNEKERKWLLKEADELTAIFTATSKSLNNKN